MEHYRCTHIREGAPIDSICCVECSLLLAAAPDLLAACEIARRYFTFDGGELNASEVFAALGVAISKAQGKESPQD